MVSRGLMLCVVFACVVADVCPASGATAADPTVLRGELEGTLDREGSPYLVQGRAVVPYGKRLNVRPGVIVMFGYQEHGNPTGSGKLIVEGSIQAVGLPNSPIVFTSVSDQRHNPGGGPSGSPYPRPWGWIEVLGVPRRFLQTEIYYPPDMLTPEEQELFALLPGQAGPSVANQVGRESVESEEAPVTDSSSVFINCTFRYAGYYALLLAVTTQVQDCIFQENFSCPIGIFWGKPVIRRCHMADNHSHGIFIQGGGSAIIEDSAFVRNAVSAINVHYSPGVEIRRNLILHHGTGILEPSGSTVIEENTFRSNALAIDHKRSFFAVNAAHNYWGHETGPRDTVDDREDGGDYNPDGQGDMVRGKVIFTPFLTDSVVGASSGAAW